FAMAMSGNGDAFPIAVYVDGKGTEGGRPSEQAASGVSEGASRSSGNKGVRGSGAASESETRRIVRLGTRSAGEPKAPQVVYWNGEGPFPVSFDRGWRVTGRDLRDPSRAAFTLGRNSGEWGSEEKLVHVDIKNHELGRVRVSTEDRQGDFSIVFDTDGKESTS